MFFTQLKAATTSLTLATAVTFPNSGVGLLVTGLQLFLTTASYLDDPATSAGYSKFSHEKAASVPVSGRTAMLFIYVPSTIFLLNYLLPFFNASSAGELTGSLLNMGSISDSLVSNGREALIATMLLGHFVKRVLETLFLHKYSSKQTDGAMGGFIGFYYTLTCLLITSFSGSVPLSSMNADCLQYGLVAYTVGELGNLYHHYLLSTLRTTDKNGKVTISKSDKGGSDEEFDVKSNYLVPTGGLFDYVTMPHYFFELIAWLGIAIVSQDLNVYLVFASMCTYLLTRAKATKIWYLKNVNNYPEDRKVLVPFII